MVTGPRAQHSLVPSDAWSVGVEQMREWVGWMDRGVMQRQGSRVPRSS